jgi:hypothetical protein
MIWMLRKYALSEFLQSAWQDLTCRPYPKTLRLPQEARSFCIQLLENVQLAVQDPLLKSMYVSHLFPVHDPDLDHDVLISVHDPISHVREPLWRMTVETTILNPSSQIAKNMTTTNGAKQTNCFPLSKHTILQNFLSLGLLTQCF